MYVNHHLSEAKLFYYNVDMSLTDHVDHIYPWHDECGSSSLNPAKTAVSFRRCLNFVSVIGPYYFTFLS